MSETRVPTPLPLPVLVGALLAGHIVASMSLLVLPALAPEVAREYAIEASLIGYFITLVCVGQLVTLMWFSSVTRRFGGARIYQTGHACVCAGLAFMLAPHPLFLVVAAMFIGFGYGLLGPSFTHLLMRFAPPKRRSFIFSLQQTGVPIGGIAAALAAPSIAVVFGWRWAVLMTVILEAGVILMLQLGRAGWDNDRDRTAQVVASRPFANIVAVWRDVPLRRTALGGGALCWAQFCVGAYTVVMCVKVFGMSLIAAGAVLTIVQIASTLGRVAIGWLCDASRNAPGVMKWTTVCMLVASTAGIFIAPGWPPLAVQLLFALLGFTTGAWAGAVLAEAGRIAPRENTAGAMAGVFVYFNTGKLIGPVVFANTYWFTGSYGWALGSLLLPGVLAYVCFRTNEFSIKIQ